ncbi:hypothetical protein KJ693_11800 [bacterium]|nr:hypothetical protein [bacterium]
MPAIKVADMTKIPKKYKGQWIAITTPDTKVVGSGKSPKEALGAAKGIPNIVITRLPEKPTHYLF